MTNTLVISADYIYTAPLTVTGTITGTGKTRYRVLVNGIAISSFTVFADISIVNVSLNYYYFRYGNNTVVISAESDTGELDSTMFGLTRVATILNKPSNIYSNSVMLTWQPLFLDRTTAYQETRVFKSLDPTFATGVQTVFVTTDKQVLSFTEVPPIDQTALTMGKYYYRIEIKMLHGSYTGDKVSFNLSDESSYIQENSSKTDFVDGKVQRFVIFIRYAWMNSSISPSRTLLALPFSIFVR